MMDKDKKGKGGIAIIISMLGKKPKGKKSKSKKTEMMYGGMASGKKHMYSGGGSVTDNAGLRALKKASPEAYNSIKGN